MRKRRSDFWVFIAGAACLWLVSCAGPARTTRTGDFGFTDTATVVRDKVFYLLGSLERAPLEPTINRDPALEAVGRRRLEAMQAGAAGCADMACLAQALSLTDEETSAASGEMRKLYGRSGALRTFVREKLRPSGFFALSDSLPDSLLLAAAWREEARGLNHILKAYLLHQDMPYPRIDSASFYTRDPAYLDSVRRIVESVLESDSVGAPFFKPALDVCLGILNLNGRDETARFEPLSRTNGEAYRRIRTTPWKRFPYSAILVFGEGPEEAGVEISPHNQERCAAAAALFKQGKAPFLIVSGGYVHPFRTPYCEAEEMKKYMIAELGVPAEAIILEPHARHTTTNIRNANRILYRNGFPVTMPVLGVSSPGHISYMANGGLDRTCLRDLGYLPYRHLRQLTAETIVYEPSPLSLQLNAEEPLDP